VALTLEHVGYTYGAGTGFAQRALADVDMEVRAGMLTLVLGRTGAGKSTLLRVASGLLIPDRGAVILDGERVGRMIAGREGGVGLVFQSPETQLFADTVLEDVAFGPRNQGLGPRESREVAHLAIVDVGLDPDTFGSRSPFGLSGGEARRVALAGVLAMKPAYVLLDEPTAGLDARGRAAVRRIIESLRERSGVVVVTHDAEEFLADADEVVILHDGHVSFAGSGASLVEDPTHFTGAGLEPPDIVRAQMLAREAGADLSGYALDPQRVATMFIEALGGART
jgi:energy-coupling factor transport system ATP-binding protein